MAIQVLKVLPEVRKLGSLMEEYGPHFIHSEQGYHWPWAPPIQYTDYPLPPYQTAKSNATLIPSKTEAIRFPLHR